MSDELNRRNTEGAMQAIRNMDIMTRQTRIMVDNVNMAISSLNERLTAAENAINMMRITIMGSGPTK